MEKITTSKLFTKTLILIVILFGVIATATSVLSGWTLYRGLTTEYQSKGIAIAKSVADSSVEILLNRDLSTVQAIIDQFGEIGGVAYVFVSDGQGEMVSHTFVPAVPKEVLPLIEQSRASPSTGEVVTTKLQEKDWETSSIFTRPSWRVWRDSSTWVWTRVLFERKFGPLL